MPKSQRIKVTLSLEVDALDLLNKAVTMRKRGWFVSTLLRQALAQEKTVTVRDVIATLRAYEGALRGVQDGGVQHRGPTWEEGGAGELW